MNGNRIIPEHLQEQINAMPEHSYGMTKICVILNNGLRVNDVFVAWGNEIVKVGVNKEVAFDPSDIVAVERQ